MPHLYERVHLRGADPNATPVERHGASMMEAHWKTYHCSGRVVLVPHLYERVHFRGADPNATPAERPGASIMEALWKTQCFSGPTCFGATSV